MSKFPTQEDIINSILKGTQKAKNNFLFWTNNRLSLSYAPHKIVTIHIAQELAKIQNAPEIFIDASISDILRCSLPNRKQFLDFMNKRELKEGTFSITLDERFLHKNHNDSISRVIISSQGNVLNTKQDYINEIHRICKILTIDEDFPKSSLDYGVFAFYTDLSKDARKKLDKRIPSIIKKFDTIIARYPKIKANFKGSKVLEDETKSQWSAGCYIIEPIKK